MNVRPHHWIRAASILTALYASGHTIGRPWTPSRTAEAAAVVGQMRSVTFVAAGSTRSYWEFYQGFGVAISGLVLVQAVLLWQLAGIARDGGRYRGMIAAHLLGFVFLGAVSARYLFAVPTVFSLVIAAVLGTALIGADRPSAAAP